MKTKNPEGQRARWIDALSSYQFDVRHMPGRKHSDAVALSRIPYRQGGREEEIYSIRTVTTQLTTEFELMQKEQTNDNSISVDTTWSDKGEDLRGKKWTTMVW